MVDIFYKHSNDTTLLKRALPTLDKEYSFWMKHRSVKVQHPKTGTIHILNRFKANTNKPRIESYMEDIRVADFANLTGTARETLFQNLASGAESGWDFTARYASNPKFNDSTTNLSRLIPMDILPIDLNSLMQQTGN